MRRGRRSSTRARRPRWWPSRAPGRWPFSRRSPPVDLAAIPYYWFGRGPILGEEALLSRTGYTGEDGFEVYVSPQRAPDLWNALLEAGTPLGLLPCGLGARDTLRLEAKMALYGNDIDDEHTVLEADLAWIVKLQKGEFIGRDALARQKAEGVTRKLVGFEMVGRGIARSHYPIVAAGVRIGEVTSGAPSPWLRQGDRPRVRGDRPCRGRHPDRDPDPRPAGGRPDRSDTVLQAIPLTQEECTCIQPDLKYSKEHEWVKVEGARGRIGLTHHAQTALGDVVFVEVPKVGRAVKQMEAFGVVESVKAVSDVYSPVGGAVVEVNAALETAPELVNKDCYGAGWIVVVEIGQREGAGRADGRHGVRGVSRQRGALTFRQLGNYTTWQLGNETSGGGADWSTSQRVNSARSLPVDRLTV